MGIGIQETVLQFMALEQGAGQEATMVDNLLILDQCSNYLGPFSKSSKISFCGNSVGFPGKIFKRGVEVKNAKENLGAEFF